ncbi:hypothetical protein [Streptomyces fagopyri]
MAKPDTGRLDHEIRKAMFENRSAPPRPNALHGRGADLCDTDLAAARSGNVKPARPRSG